MALGTNNSSIFYQTYYPEADLPWLLPSELPLLNMLIGGNTDGQVSGLTTDMPWLLGPPNGGSMDFNVAQENSNLPVNALRPTVRLGQYYKNLDFLDKDQLLSQGDASYADLMQKSIEGARMDIFNKLDQLLHGAGNGITCSVATSGTSTTINLDTQATETIFELNDRIVITSNAPTDGTPPTIAQGPFTVVAVDQGSITVNASITVTAGNGISFLGNTMGFNSAMMNPAIIGVEAYNPTVKPASNDNFLGVNRSVYSNRASGYRVDGTKRSIEGAVRRLATVMKQGGNTANGGAIAMISPIDHDALENKMATYQRFNDYRVGNFYLDAVVLSSPLGRLNCVVDPHQKQGQARIYVPGGLQLQYRNNLPHVATLSNGTDESFGEAFDGRATRLRAYAQMRCLDPRKQGNTSLPAVA